MTLGDLLRQDGALALLTIGAVLGFFVATLFRAYAKENESRTLEATPQAPPAYASSPLKAAALIAAITAAVNKYQNDNLVR